MKYLIGTVIGLLVATLITLGFISSANKVQTDLMKEGLEIIKDGRVNDSFLHIKLDSILEFKRKEWSDG